MIFLFSLIFLNIWSIFKIAPLISLSANSIIISVSISIVGCFSPCYELHFFYEAILFWGQYLMPHDLRDLYTLASVTLSGPVWTQIVPPTFLQIFSLITIVFFTYMCRWVLSQRSRRPFCKSLGLCAVSSSLLCPPWAQNIVSLTQQNPWSLFRFLFPVLWSRSFFQTVSGGSYWVHLVYLSFPGLLFHTVCVQCLKTLVLYFIYFCNGLRWEDKSNPWLSIMGRSGNFYNLKFTFLYIILFV